MTACGLLFGLAAAGLVAWQPQAAPFAALLVLAAWLCDRTDGPLARKQRSVSAWGGWLDSNVDELLDVAWHTGVAAAAGSAGSPWPWALLAGFVAGKYLFMHGVWAEQEFGIVGRGSPGSGPGNTSSPGLLRRLYHLPGNADVRVHLVIAALVSGWFVWELALVAAYYQCRWPVRYGLVARRAISARGPATSGDPSADPPATGEQEADETCRRSALRSDG